ncbi:hypothetical protein [Undibacterium terreum]|uniref:Uncharacterized protein n=1 Tax=Undibacterium terreum TaxID=1224302 RepID=A0A916XDB8_9BURK|nr:hypothetical protein [Undibacterium terreum]GGC65537.1 hypothetical protein GCM10011396_10700 [Undibacterium terreum]
MKKFLIAVLLMSASSLCLAQAQLNGRFKNADTTLHIIVLQSHAPVAVAVSARVTKPECPGRIAGLGSFKGQTIKFSPYVTKAGGEACVITAEFDKTFERPKVTAGEGCAAYKEAMCALDGRSLKYFSDN